MDRLLTAAWHGAGDATPDLSAVIARLRRRWRLRLLLDGLFRTVLAMLLLIILCAWLLNIWHFTAAAVWSLRLLTIVSLLGLLLHYCIKPLRRRVSDASVALYLEEHEPSLRTVMLSAVDARQAQAEQASPQLAARLAEQALEASAPLAFGQAVEQTRLRQASIRLGLIMLAILALLLAPPEFLRHGAGALLMPWSGAAEYSPYRLEVTPGDIEIARGGDQLIGAGIAGFDGDDVVLFTSKDAGASWRQTTMTRGDVEGVYESFLFDLQQPVDYYVVAAGRQSPTYSIRVADIPAIEHISLRYHYPDYTMLEAETSEGSGDITALRGTRVQVRIRPTIAIPGGALQLSDSLIELLPEGDEWIGEILVQDDDAYRVSLQRASGISVDASADFRITALQDGFPGVSILSPGRDRKVSMIEEPVMKIRASDDQGVSRLELVLAVNGGVPQRIELIGADQSLASRRELDAEHTLFLEDLKLSPGDLISYYVQAADNAPTDMERNATSDIFFYQVRPFSTRYHSAEQQGGGGGGAQGGEQQGHLSDQQKQFVIATFKMIRDRAQFDAEAYADNLSLLARAQARIRDRVEAIIRRIGSRSMVQAGESLRVITEELPLAAAAMLTVEQQLKQQSVTAALTDAQLALRHLQRADAAFRDINVSLGNAGGAGAAAGMEELADLFRLEMDKLRNQYETVQHGQPQSPAQVIDETLEKLRELARRQQQQLEQQLRSQQMARNSGVSAQQLALAEELEEMARQLQRLSRKQPEAQLQQSIKQMQDAAAAMRRAASSAGEAGLDQARQATEKLREARNLLDQSRVQQFSDQVQRSLRRAEQAERQQAAIKQEVQDLDEKWGEKLKAQLRQLDQNKRALSEDLVELERELGELATTAGEEQPRARQPLKQAIRASREHRLQDRIGRTATMVQVGEKQQALKNEDEIQRGIAAVREHIETALNSVGQTGEGELQRSLEQMRAMARELQSLREMRQQTAEPGSQVTASARAGATGNPNGWPGLDGITSNAPRLGQRLLELGIASGDVNPVIDKIMQLSRARGDAELSAELHDQALQALKELEYRLRRQSSKPHYPQLLVGENTDLTDDYREMVADYFRELSRR